MAAGSRSCPGHPQNFGTGAEPFSLTQGWLLGPVASAYSSHRSFQKDLQDGVAWSYQAKLQEMLVLQTASREAGLSFAGSAPPLTPNKPQCEQNTLLRLTGHRGPHTHL